MGRFLFTLFLINLVPVVSVVVFGWSATALLLLYWGENVIFGVITLAKIFISGLSKGPWSVLPTLFYAAFFVFHYGIFCLVHATFIFAFTDPAGEPNTDELLSLVTTRIAADPVLSLNLLLLSAFHVFNFVACWLIPGAWRGTTPRFVMFSPYGRIVVVHVALLMGGIAAATFGQPVLVVAALALLKTFLESATQYAGDDAAPSGGPVLAKPRP